MAAAINMTALVLNLLSDAKSSFADPVRHTLLVAQIAATALPVKGSQDLGFLDQRASAQALAITLFKKSF